MTNKWIIILNEERYQSLIREEHPTEVIIHGTLEQARFVQQSLSSMIPGCDYFYYIEGEDE